mmetsp:Transcript_25107/g.74586  ORF Transcript_25107/g.74586 Transcript_25107/m.74586 type:complete len:214 (+) Transcript_25107:169-810(+)
MAETQESRERCVRKETSDKRERTESSSATTLACCPRCARKLAEPRRSSATSCVERPGSKASCSSRKEAIATSPFSHARWKGVMRYLSGRVSAVQPPLCAAATSTSTRAASRCPFATATCRAAWPSASSASGRSGAPASRMTRRRDASPRSAATCRSEPVSSVHHHGEPRTTSGLAASSLEARALRRLQSSTLSTSSHSSRSSAGKTRRWYMDG